MNLLAAVIAAHVVSEILFEFILLKNMKKVSLTSKLAHIPIVFIAIFLVSLFYLNFNMALFKAVLNVMSHYAIDITVSKLNFKKFSLNKAYLIDETMHIIMIIIIYDL